MRIYVILGPTASGKSGAALAVAQRAGAEIVSADSMQVYRGMDIGTAKPTRAERARVPHHLIDVVDPWESFSTAEYVRLADEAIADIARRGRIALVVGGTALYLKSLLVGIFRGPSADWRFRGALRKEAEASGVVALHERLSKIDPEAARRIHPNDLRRIERALEVHEKTGKRPSSLRREWTAGENRYDATVVGISWAREKLRARIDERVDRMIAAGWLAEVKELLASTAGPGREASQALGYAQLRRVASGDMDLAGAVDEIKRKTRRSAKAQMTWFKAFPGVGWVDGASRRDGGDLVDAVMDALGLHDGNAVQGQGGNSSGGR